MGQPQPIPASDQKEKGEWMETYPPVALHRSDPRYWPYKETTQSPSEVHCGHQGLTPKIPAGQKRVSYYRYRKLGLFKDRNGMRSGLILLDGHTYSMLEFDGRYWPNFKFWHGLLERAIL